jgi:benzodiazapine receptor
MAETTTMSTTTVTDDRSFNKYNFANVFAYLLNVFVTFGIGLFGIGGRPDNSELSDKYQTIVTPSGYAFSIWGPIFILQAMWMLWQLLPSQRNQDAIQAVGFKYLYVCLAQAGWTLSFSWEIMWLALLCMFAILAGLVWIMVVLQKVDNITLKGYFIWQFPFSMHTGWICAASAVNVNVLVVFYNANVNTQIAIAALSLVALFCVAATVLMQYPTDFTIPAVLAWALAAVYVALQSPQDSIRQQFTKSQIYGFAVGSITGVAVILFGMLIKLAYVFAVQRPAAAAEQEQEEQPPKDSEADGTRAPSDQDFDEEA